MKISKKDLAGILKFSFFIFQAQTAIFTERLSCFHFFALNFELFPKLANIFDCSEFKIMH